MHAEHERCFPYVAGATSGNEAAVNALFDLSGGSNAVVTQAASATATTLKVDASSKAGLTSSSFDCPPCKPVHVKVCTPMGFGYGHACELMEVTQLHATDLPVLRGAGGTTALAHAIGRCTCVASRVAAGVTVADCESKTTASDCATAGGTWEAATVRVVDAKILPALENEGEFTLRSLTLSYATR